MTDVQRERPTKKFGFFSRFRRSEDGATAIEFAIVGPLFLFIVITIFEHTLFFFSNQYLETGVDTFARDLRTGRLGATPSSAELQQELCKRIDVIFDCDEIRFDIQVEEEFQDFDPPPTFNASNQFEPGPGDLDNVLPQRNVRISVYSPWAGFTNLSTYFDPTDIPNDTNYMYASAVIRTENYQIAGSGG